MKSIVLKDHRSSEHRETQTQKYGHTTEVPVDDDIHPSKTETPEKKYSDKEIIQRIRDLFPENQDMQDVIDGYLLGMTAKDVQDASGMSAEKYDACRKRLFRTDTDLLKPEKAK